MSGAVNRLVLASTSPARRRLLASAGVPFEAIAPGVDETAAKAAMRAEGMSPRDQADALAELKARAGWRRGGGLTLGCDQILEVEGEAVDKADTLDQVAAQLRALRGRSHRLHSAAVLVDDGEPVWRQLTTVTLRMRPFSEDFLARYLTAAGEALTGSVGGYHVEGIGAQLFEQIDGDVFAIQGLPLLPVLGALRARGIMPS